MSNPLVLTPEHTIVHFVHPQHGIVPAVITNAGNWPLPGQQGLRVFPGNDMDTFETTASFNPLKLPNTWHWPVYGLKG